MTESKSVALPLGDAPAGFGERSATGSRNGAEDSDIARGAQPTPWVKIDLSWGLAGGYPGGYNAASYWSGVWRSLVAHLVRDEGVGGSNPLTPTSSINGQTRALMNAKSGSSPCEKAAFRVSGVRHAPENQRFDITPGVSMMRPA